MDNNDRPHSRKKTVGSGSADVGRGRKVSGSSSPVGSGGRKASAPSGNRASGTQLFGSGKKLNLKTILIIAVIAIALIFILKNFGGGGLSDSPLSGNSDAPSNSANTSSSDIYSSYAKPDYSVSKLAREKRVTPVGNGKDIVTVMVYMCGTDLESKYGMATKDINEMLSAKISDKVNLIIETGGCKKWKNNTISSSKNQIYKVESGGLKRLKDNAGTAAMTDPKNLTSFINFCEENYPADRNMLIFWDHGGGSLTGYGYDEKNPNSSSMTLDKINSALKSADCTFDFIGFDACLMATLETALVSNGYADYLIASEETEPGTGWYYTNWLTELSSDTSVSTVDLGQTIIDDFVSSCRSASPSAGVTLSLVDLAELQGTVPSAFKNFSTSTNTLIKSDDYKRISDARANVRQFSPKSKINQVDLVDLADGIATDESKALSKVLHGCVKYNQSTMSRCNGISIYFPYESTSSVKNAVASYKALGIDSEYSDCIKSFASLELGGQIASSASQLPDISQFFGSSGSSSGSSGSGSIGTDLLGTLLSSYIGGGSSSSAPTTASTSPLSVLLGNFQSGGTSSAGSSIDAGSLINLLGSFSGRSMPKEYDWVDTELIADNAEKIVDNYLDPSHIKATKKNGQNVLDLTDDEWKLVQTVEYNVFVKDGDGYIDMGLDNTFDLNDDKDLLLTCDDTWLTINGNACAYYLVSDIRQADGSYVTTGRIPALLNGKFVNLQVVFDDGHPEGTVTGAYPLYENDSIGVQAKGNIEIKEGDKIELLCDYYDLDGNYSESYTLDTSFKVPKDGLKLENLKLNAKNVSCTYRLTDIYGNHYWIKVK